MDNSNTPPPVPRPPAKPTGSLILDETIEDVDKSTNKLILTRHKNTATWIIAASVAWELIMGCLLVYGPPVGKEDLRLTALVLPFFVIGGFYAYFRNQILHAFYKQFARANNFTYAEKGDTFGLTGALFNIGHSHGAQDKITGTWDGNPITLFNYSYATGSGKQKTTYSCTVSQITYPSVLAPMLLVVDNQYFGGIGPVFGNKTKVKTEGNFDKTFDLYAKKEFEIEALQVFTPDVLAKLLELWPDFNLEFNCNQITVFRRGTITTKAKLQNMYDLVQYLITKIEPVAARMESGLKAMHAAHVK